MLKTKKYQITKQTYLIQQKEKEKENIKKL